MSKITRALEKAARERLRGDRDEVTVSVGAVTVPVVMSRVGEIASAGEVHIDPHIVSVAEAMSPIAEQYRILRTNLLSNRLRGGPKVVVVTSAVNGEGKSVTAVNLALSLAQQDGLKVVLVDLDLRKSTVHRWLGLEEPPQGTSTVLSRDGVLNGALLQLQSPRLAVLPSGPTPEQPAELLGSTAMKRMVAALRNEFDVVIIDTPPVMMVADAGIIASQADGVLFVVRAGRTQRKTVRQTLAILTQMKATLFGCVLTHVEHYLPGYYGYYHYRRYHETSKETNGKSAAKAVGKENSASPAKPLAPTGTAA